MAAAAATSEPVIISSKPEMLAWSRRHRRLSHTIALVPTMGSLHAGHLSLISHAASLADLTVVSIYLNPTQFAPGEDLATYPADLAADLRKLRACPAVAAVFCPTNLYADGHDTWVRVEELEQGLCGVSRPAFFRGVATVVAKLFHLVEPDVAVFGKKDFQQWRVIEKMVRDLDFPVRIVGSEIVREVDGLAMSSRNVRLSPEEREKALSISRSLSRAKVAAQNGSSTCQKLKDIATQSITEAGGRIDYVEILGGLNRPAYCQSVSFQGGNHHILPFVHQSIRSTASGLCAGITCRKVPDGLKLPSSIKHEEAFCS